MKPVAALAFLLASYLFGCAHAGRGDEWGWKDFQSLEGHKPYASVRKSAVENWSLLCEELCGVGFGWPACGGHCVRKTTHRRDIIKIAGFCPVLCEYGFGGSICVCPVDLNTKNNYDAVCNEFCVRKNLSMKGCRSCDNPSWPVNWDNITETFLNSTDPQSAHGGHVGNESTILTSVIVPETTTATEITNNDTVGSTTDTFVATTTPFANVTTTSSTSSSKSSIPTTSDTTTSSDPSSSSPRSNLTTPSTDVTQSTQSTTPSTVPTSTQSTTGATGTTPPSTEIPSPFSPTSSESTTSESMPTTVRSTSDSITESTTTPKWEEWCKKLCSIGEGGAACHCDLLPLSAE